MQKNCYSWWIRTWGLVDIKITLYPLGHVGNVLKVAQITQDIDLYLFIENSPYTRETYFWTELENERSPDQTPNIKVAQDSGIYRFTIRFFSFSSWTNFGGGVRCHRFLWFALKFAYTLRFFDNVVENLEKSRQRCRKIVVARQCSTTFNSVFYWARQRFTAHLTVFFGRDND